ncbi:hypothetical protein ACN47E_005063 [Coniothyrium glycines]
MQFSILAITAALAATTAAHVPANGTSVAYYPTGTGSAKPTGTGILPSGSTTPFTGAASMPTHISGSALGLFIAGGVALLL